MNSKSSNGVARNRIIPTRYNSHASAKIRDVFTNAKQTRVLIQILDPQLPAYAAMVQRIFPKYRFASKPVERLYVYKVPEGRLQDLGSVPRGSYYPALSPRWLGNTNTIEFYYDLAVYTVPADPSD